jgi:DNA repair protein RadC
VPRPCRTAGGASKPEAFNVCTGVGSPELRYGPRRKQAGKGGNSNRLTSGLRCGGGLPCRPTLPRRSRRQGLRARLRRALAACGRLRTLTAALRRGASVSGNPARYRPEFAMSSSTSSIVPALLVRDVDGQYRPASAEEVLSQARRVLSHRVRRGATMSSPQAVKDYLLVEIGVLEHEVFCVLFLDAQHRIIALKQMFRGTVTQTSVYPREVVKEALAVNAAAVILAHNHPSGAAEPSRADEFLTQTLKTALALVDVRVLDHLVVAGSDARSFAELGLL